MRVLVTGGAGFQGSALTRALSVRGDQVAILNTPSTVARSNASRLEHSTTVWGSVTDPEVVNKAAEGCAAIVHMAAWANPDQSLDDPMASVRTNVLGTQTVLEAARRLKIPLLHVSSCEVYGSVSAYRATQDEDAPLRPTTPYAAGKAAADVLVWSYGVAYQLPLIIVRPCNVYGPGQRAGRYGAVIPTFVANVMGGRPMEVRGGDQSREYIYLDDVVSRYVQILDSLILGPSPLPRVYNLGSGHMVSIQGIAEQIQYALEGEIVFCPPRAGDVSAFRLDSSKGQRDFGFPVPLGFPAGLQRYIAWARAVQLLKFTHTQQK